MKAVTYWLILGTSVSLLCCCALSQGNSYLETPSLNRIVDALEQAQAGVRPAVSYQVVREYRLSSSRDARSDSEVFAEMNFRTPAKKDYTVQKTSGSDRGLQVVRHLLDHEVAAASSQDRMALTRDNYDFSYIGDTTLDGQRCYILTLRPKRKETDLIIGQLWVDEHSFVVRHIEGELARSPSWWVRRVNVKVSFSELGGAWLQTEMEATADVRIAGPYTLTSRTLDYRPANDVATAGPSIQPVRHKP